VDKQKQWLRRLPMLAGSAVVVVVLVTLVVLIRYYVTHKDINTQRKVQVVQVIRPPPPPPDEPPPPPPPEAKPDEVMPQDEPEPAPSDAAQPSAQLGLDTEGGAGGDAFGLIGHKGGHDITGSGGAIFAWYTNRLKDLIVDRLTDDPKIRSKKFTVSVKFWIESDGHIRDVRLASSSGNRELDADIASVLGKLSRIGEPPPLEMPQPISLRIVSRS